MRETLGKTPGARKYQKAATVNSTRGTVELHTALDRAETRRGPRKLMPTAPITAPTSANVPSALIGYIPIAANKSPQNPNANAPVKDPNPTLIASTPKA
jgi:hypothetical protein